MSGLIWVVIGIIALVLVIGIILTIVFWKKQEERRYKEPDYEAFFIMGISFLPLGIVFMIAVSPAFIGFTGIGLCYMAIGLANKDKWKKEE